MCSEMKQLFLFIFWITCFHTFNICLSVIPSSSSHGTKIEKKFFVIQNDDPEPIILDCDYDAENYQSSLLVKWLKNGKTIYHWIKGHDPVLYPPLKLHIDDKYEASTDVNYKHRAIKFPEPNIELSGNYSCLITMNTTHTNYIELQIVDIRQLEFNINADSTGNDTRVTCEADNVYPQPSLTLAPFGDDDDLLVSKVSEEYIPGADGFFNATTSGSVLGFDTNDVITCVLSFPGIEFNMTKSLTSSAAVINGGAGVIATIIVIFFSLL